MASLEQRFWAKVDKTGGCWIWTASKDGCGYGMMRVSKTRVMRAHRVAYEWLSGPIPEGMLLDHVCHNPACVRPDHLRPVTVKANAENRISANLGNRSGIRGVRWNVRQSKWHARVGHNGHVIHVGFFDNIADAAAAVKAKRCELHTHNDMDRTA